jgi:6,7-dimethyl-8-ribityllumazine synthase
MRTEKPAFAGVSVPGAHVLVIAAPYYTDVVETMCRRAVAAIEAAGATSERLDVPGAFELPGAIAMALPSARYHGYVALGCVVRGETSHYDYVCGESARGLMDLSLQGVALGYGVLTVENLEQARVRADPAAGDKGAEAARAALAMIAWRRQLAGR